MIDDYLSGSTLSTSIDYYNFNKLFGSKTSMYSYFEPPVMFHNMKDFLSAESWQKMQKNKEYFTCFSQAGIQAGLSDEMIHFTMKAKYQPEIEDWKKKYYNAFEIVSMFNASSQAVSVTGSEKDQAAAGYCACRDGLPLPCRG